MIKNFRYILFFVLITLTLSPLRGEVRARIAELESDEEYMELIAQSANLAKGEDSLSMALSHNRKLYNQGGDDVATYRDNVIVLEQNLFDLRARRGAVASQISEIEQRWELDNVGYMPQMTEVISVSKSHVALVKNDNSKSISQSIYAAGRLADGDHKKLLESELDEQKINSRVRSYVANYEVMARLREEYSQSASQNIADSIFIYHHLLDSINRASASVIRESWSSVYDNKSYLYALLIEKMGRMDIFEKEESSKILSAQIVDSLHSTTSCEVLLNYYAQKLSMVEYEMVIAQELKLANAVDSLRVVRDSMRIAGFNYPSVLIEKQSLILYEEIKFADKTPYSQSKPIPSTKIYKEGLIYRLLLGTYNSKQLPTIFRGAYPLSVEKTKSGHYAYYTGGYQTFSEAESARKMLSDHGFRRPEVVEWRDGESVNLTRNPRVDGSKYRVDIKGVGELSQAVRDVVESLASDKELLKVAPQSFIIRLFDDLESATIFSERLKTVDENLQVSVVAVD